jgi:hypothetical protein
VGGNPSVSPSGRILQDESLYERETISYSIPKYLSLFHKEGEREIPPHSISPTRGEKLFGNKIIKLRIIGTTLALRFTAAGLDQGDALSAEGTLLRLVGYYFGAMAGIERHAEVRFLRGAENEDADADDVAFQFFNGGDDLADRPAGRHDVIDDEDFFSRCDMEAATE